jgi:hypothetical protein
MIGAELEDANTDNGNNSVNKAATAMRTTLLLITDLLIPYY